MRRIILIALILLTTLVAAEVTQAQSTNQPLVLLVRDGAGNPLPGVALDILVTGPPHELFDNCVTDAAGQCRLLLAPGPYLVQFTLGWRGTLFIDPARQNAAALDDGGVTGGGFGIYLEPAESEQVVTFVVGQRDGRLVPVWDMSRSPEAAPQPYLPPELPFSNEDPLVGIDLSPLVVDEQDDAPTPFADATEDSQVVESTVESPAIATAAPEPTPLPVTTEAKSSSPALLIIAVVLVLTAAGAFVYVVVRLIASRKEGRDG